MKVFAISDLHLSFSSDKPMEIFGDGWQNHTDIIKRDWQDKVSDGDVVLLAGDFSWAMTLENALIDFEFLKDLKGEKFLIRGNHDYWWQSYSKLCSAVPFGVHCIQNNAIRYNGIVFCGTRGWSVPENGDGGADVKYLEREYLRLELSLKEAAKLKQEGDEIIAMIHYPPFNSKYEKSRFTSLFSEYGVSVVVFGHLHGSATRMKDCVKIDGVRYYLTSCDLLKNKLLGIKI